MSPEQLEGRPIDARADLFAAGVVLYQLLTSQRPFDGDTDFAVIQKIVNHTPAAATFFNPKLPPAIDAVVAKALAKSRDMRYSSAQDFSSALHAACKEAADATIAPQAVLPAKGSNITWTATMMPGESLVATESGVGTGSGTSSSLVTQEVELVYWKDIKESSDVEDILGFLAKFPSGIYADLARRRLKNLGAGTHPEPTLVSPRGMASELAPAATAADTTLLLPKRDSAPVETPTAPVATVAESAAATAQPVTAQAAHAASPKKALWLVAGVAALAVIGATLKLLSGPSTAPVPAAALATASSALLQASASAPAVTAQGAASAAVPTLAAAPAARPTASAVGVATRAAMAASKAAGLISSKKVVTGKDKAEGVTPSVSSPQAARAAPAVATPTAPATGSGPRAACEDRMLLGFQTCMSEQCARPVFTQHPICVERRVMEERRREEQRNRQ